jgi:hypothetical protein
VSASTHAKVKMVLMRAVPALMWLAASPHGTFATPARMRPKK